MLGPSLDRAALWPKVQEYAAAAGLHIAQRTLPPSIEHVWAWVADYDDHEHVIGIPAGNAHHPMIDSDLALLRLARPVMEEIARQTGWTIKLVRFDRQGVSIDTVGS